jgi:hypothetical protein
MLLTWAKFEEEQLRITQLIFIIRLIVMNGVTGVTQVQRFTQV